MENIQPSGQDKNTGKVPPSQEQCEKAALTEIATTRQQAIGIVSSEPKSIGDVLPKVMQRLVRAQLTDEELKEREVQARRQEIARKWSEFTDYRGSRYADCRLVNFTIETESQKVAVESIKTYCEEIRANVASGANVILFGPRGTGKDHLAMAIAHAAILAGVEVAWRNGMDLWGDFRDAIDTEGARESAMIRKLIQPQLLYISDPLPIAGPLTQHQMNQLSRILDGRYSRRKAVLCTVNVASGTELDERMGPQNSDRLKDGALAIYCNWPSYRKVGKLL